MRYLWHFPFCGLVAVLLFLGGCVSEVPNIILEGVDEAVLERDRSECEALYDKGARTFSNMSGEMRAGQRLGKQSAWIDLEMGGEIAMTSPESGAVGGALGGAAYGAMRASEVRDACVAWCLSDRGYRFDAPGGVVWTWPVEGCGGI